MAREAEWTSERQGPMPVQSEEGSREDGGVWSSCRGKQRGDLNGLFMGIQMRLNSQLNNPTNTLHPKASRKVFKVVLRWGSKLFSWIWRTRSSPPARTCRGRDNRKPSSRRHKILILEVCWLLNLYDVLDYSELGLSWEESSTNNHLLGPKTSAASEGSSSRHTLLERK